MSEKLTKADNLCKELAATLSQNPDTVEITITIPHPSLGTTTVTGDEIEQSVTKTTEIEPDVGPGVVGDLLIDELDSWHVGICEVKTGDTDDLLVYGENDHLVERIDTDVWTNSVLFPDTEVKDLAKIANMINSAIASEYGAL